MLPTEIETTHSEINGLEELQAQTLGDPEICIAVLDGAVDGTHPCFAGADLTYLPTLVTDGAGAGPMSAHGTHVASILFGQPGSSVTGLAPRCKGLIVPVFVGGTHRLSQLDLARAIEQAVEHGANIINVSGGERSSTDEADDLLARALHLCEENRVLVVAAAGNDGCECLSVPAAVGSVLAVGAMDKKRRPLSISNWGPEYLEHGVVAPGENIRGAVPGGGVALRTGTSFATPIVAGVAGLLLSIQRERIGRSNPREVGDAIVASALPCDTLDASDSSRCLAGILNITGAYTIVTQAKGTKMSELEASGPNLPPMEVSPSSADREQAVEPGEQELGSAHPRDPSTKLVPPLGAGGWPSSVEPSGTCMCGERKDSYVFAIGTIGYDFGTEARRDSFRQLMPIVNDRPANPYVTEQMVSYLEANPSESTKLIWTFNLELTPVYAIQAEIPYARDVYDFFRKALHGQIQDESNPEYISRVSLPGILSTRTVRLFSGQVVPVVVAQYRGLWSWNVNVLVDAITARFETREHDTIKAFLQNFLDKVYYELRNLGQTSPDRALNYSATNAFQATDAMTRALNPKEIVPGAGMYMLDDIAVSKSPFCRMDSDCWDIKLRFFDPENDRRARMVMRFTVDVSDGLPVTLGPVRHWTESAR